MAASAAALVTVAAVMVAEAATVVTVARSVGPAAAASARTTRQSFRLSTHLHGKNTCLQGTTC